jgi:hypothetical protein
MGERGDGVAVRGSTLDRSGGDGRHRRAAPDQSGGA